MEFRVAGNELHVGGPVEGYELGLFIDVTRAHPKIDTVVFRNSPGGDAWTAFRVGERIRDAGMRTVVAGRCVSACTIMFLGGRTRHFIEASRPESMYLAFHGTWSAAFMQGHNPAFAGRVQVRAWIVERTGGKVDPAVLERFLGFERRAALLYVYDPAQLKSEVTTGDAFSMGFVNSAERVRVTPPRELPPPFKPNTEPYSWPTERH